MFRVLLSKPWDPSAGWFTNSRLTNSFKAAGFSLIKHAAALTEREE